MPLGNTAMTHDIPSLFWGNARYDHKFDETPHCAKQLISFRSWKAQELYKFYELWLYPGSTILTNHMGKLTRSRHAPSERKA